MLHFNLIVLISLKNITTILTKSLVILDALKEPKESNKVLEKSEISCKVLAVFDNIFRNAIFTSMFADGFYLHKVIVRIFEPDPNVHLLITIIIGKSTNFI